MYVENGWLSLDPIYLSLLHSHKFSDNFSDMDVRAQDCLSYHLTMGKSAVNKHAKRSHVRSNKW